MLVFLYTKGLVKTSAIIFPVSTCFRTHELNTDSGTDDTVADNFAPTNEVTPTVSAKISSGSCFETLPTSASSQKSKKKGQAIIVSNSSQPKVCDSHTPGSNEDSASVSDFTTRSQNSSNCHTPLSTPVVLTGNSLPEVTNNNASNQLSPALSTPSSSSNVSVSTNRRGTPNAHNSAQALRAKSKDALFSMLMEWPKGRMILAYHEKHGELNDLCKGELVELILNNELKEDPSKKLSPERLTALGEAITQLFPSEDKTVYFIPYYKGLDGNKHFAKGKLWDKYRKIRKMFMDTDLIAKKE
ncbi:unnamed protein product [Bemisia tabaci]|uniref:Uncharacterized protein n=1 Tax=Bemisia tabaci TaxID=7038 RepID=A0A9P0A734_BEMTA|nr:unnamed protein product [Bemisia tabaci]